MIPKKVKKEILIAFRVEENMKKNIDQIAIDNVVSQSDVIRHAINNLIKFNNEQKLNQ